MSEGLLRYRPRSHWGLSLTRSTLSALALCTGGWSEVFLKRMHSLFCLSAIVAAQCIRYVQLWGNDCTTRVHKICKSHVYFMSKWRTFREVKWASESFFFNLRIHNEKHHLTPAMHVLEGKKVALKIIFWICLLHSHPYTYCLLAKSCGVLSTWEGSPQILQLHTSQQ